MTDKFWIEGPMHPDLFDGETPTRKEVAYEDLGLMVFKVECTYYVQEEETHFVVAPSYAKAEDIAWEKIQEEQTGMDTAEVTEMELEQELVASSHTIFGGERKTARQLLEEHLRENPCILTPNS